MKKSLLSAAALIIISNANALTINVPVDYTSIQSAINASSNGDSIIVDSGTYNENIDFSGKNIVLTSKYILANDESFIASTIIDGGGLGRVVTFQNGETSSAKLIGFTITNGDCGILINGSSPSLDHLTIEDNQASGTTSAFAGGGIYCHSSSNPLLTNLIIQNNTAYYQGGGISIRNNCNPTLENIQILNNSVDGSGGGISVNGNCTPNLFNILVADNQAYGSFGRAGGVLCENTGTPNLNNVTVVNNVGVVGGGVACFFAGDHPVFLNSIIWGNSPNNIYLYNGDITTTYSNIEGGNTGTGNIDSDPLFTDALNGDYSITVSSPCVDAGNPSTTLANVPALDLNDNPRIFNNRIDMGSYEYYVGSFVNVENIENSKKIALFPNPSNGTFILTSESINPGTYDLTVLSLDGKIVYNRELYFTSSQLSISLPNMTNGQYLVRLQGLHDTQTIKITILK